MARLSMPERRRVSMARLRKLAIARGALPVLSREASSLNVEAYSKASFEWYRYIWSLMTHCSVRSIRWSGRR